MASKFSRYKPRGWQGESYRHYLASKGVKTNNKALLKKWGITKPEELFVDSKTDKVVAAVGKDNANAIKDVEKIEKIVRVSPKNYKKYFGKKISPGVYETIYGNAVAIEYDDEGKLHAYDLDMGEAIPIEMVALSSDKIRDLGPGESGLWEDSEEQFGTSESNQYYARDDTIAFDESDSTVFSSSQTNDAAKGNYDRGGLKAAYAASLSKADLRAGAKIKTPSGNLVDAKEYFGITDEELRTKRKRSVEVVEPSIGQEEPFPKTISPPIRQEQFTTEDVVQEMDGKVDDFVSAPRSDSIPGNVVMTPGTPVRTNSFDIGGPYE